MQLVSVMPPPLDTRQHNQPGESGNGAVHVGYWSVHCSTGPTSGTSASTGPAWRAQYGVGAASVSGWKPLLLVHSQSPPPSASTQVHVVHDVCDEHLVNSHPTQ
jgi:hypothetical protein